MATEPSLRWEPPDYEPDYEPDIIEEEEEQPRDPVVDQAKDAMRAFFDQERTNVFYKQQLEVIFERDFFHWVTSRASELAADGHIVTAIFGVDGFQAIELALQFIGWRLADINSKNGGRLRWLDGELPKEWAQKEQ